jgi:hypothetical protein
MSQAPLTAAPAAPLPVEQQRLGVVQAWLGALGAAIIRLWLRVFGRTVDLAEAPWLAGPVGPGDGMIGDRPYEIVAEREGLTIDRAPEKAGLLPDFDVLAGPTFDVAAVDAEVRRFYEETSLYHLEVWSHAPFPARLFLWLLVSTGSRSMNQLNFPVTGMELARGMSSDVIPMRDAAGRTVYTGWLRRSVGAGRIVYTGFYTSEKPPGHPSRCVKVVFPLPRGNATVVLKPVLENGRFRLLSEGERFGDPGFYRVLRRDDGKLRVRYLRTLRERFAVYRDEAGVLRCDHEVLFLGMTMLRLHYKMTRAGHDGAASGPKPRAPARAEG